MDQDKACECCCKEHCGCGTEIVEEVEITLVVPEEIVDEFMIHIVNNLEDKDQLRTVLSALFNKAYYHGWKLALKEMMEVQKQTLISLKDM